jgi:hypothetical protein
MATTAILETTGQNPVPGWMGESVRKMEAEMVGTHAESSRARVNRGLSQVAAFWRDSDGDQSVFEEFVRMHFAASSAAVDALFQRFEVLFEQLDGHMHEIYRTFREQLDLDLGPVLPVDEMFGGYYPGAHMTDDMFDNKLGFVVLLNFPLTTLEERTKGAERRSRREWAEIRLAQRFDKRIPAWVNQAVTQAEAVSGRYISEYNIWMHHLVDETGKRYFPAKMRLLSHWGLRDEIKSNYRAEENGLRKQRMIQRVMEQIIQQTIPKVVINDPTVDWNPFTNAVKAAGVKDWDDALPSNLSPSDEREPDTRYAMLLKTFHAAAKADPYSPTAPTHIARRFDEDREIPETRARAMLEQVLTSSLMGRVAELIKSRLGRPLEPFDIWYSGFRPASAHTDDELNQIVARRYPDPVAYEKDIPNLLGKLGFSAHRAQYLASKISVDPARGSGHAMSAGMRSEKAHLRTRVAKTGMDYQSFNVAAHEMGHNVEQVFSLNDVDSTVMRGVPNTSFTEAFAFLFQGHDLELLDLPAPDARSKAEKILNDFWATCEISAVALVDMAVWHWMYEHREATPAELKQAVIQIAKDTWNRFYVPVFGIHDVILLAVYSHMIDTFLYLPDYPIGHLISFQIEEQMEKAGSIGPEFERMATMGRLTPDLWMTKATGRPVGAEALLAATEKALEAATRG